jgi:hypothetical protein
LSLIKLAYDSILQRLYLSQRVTKIHLFFLSQERMILSYGSHLHGVYRSIENFPVEINMFSLSLSFYEREKKN